MYIYYRRAIYLILIVFCYVCCSVLKVLENKEKNYSGDIQFLNNESIRLKFTLIIDENKNIKIKLFESLGIKVAELVVKRDSIIIESIIFDEYRKYIDDFFFKYKSTMCINYLISDIFEFKIFNMSDLPVGYIKEKDEEDSNNVIKIFNMEQDYVMSIIRNEIFINHRRSINLKFDNNKYCVLNFIDLKK
jgi:hypothetical protein